MDIEFIESKIDEIVAKLELEVNAILKDKSLDMKGKNLKIKPLSTTRQILSNAIESIKMVDKLNVQKD